MEEIKKDKVYVIGGLVDDSVKKNSTCSYAQNHGIKTAKLPIQEHCERAGSGTFKQIFTINQAKPSLKIGTANAIFWIYLGIFRDYDLKNIF